MGKTKEVVDYSEYSKWLSGFLESGSMWMRLNHSDRRPKRLSRITPGISYGDNPEIVNRLKETFGGSVNSGRKWVIKDGRAIEIANAVEFAPSKIALIEAFRALEQEQEFYRKMKILEAYQAGAYARRTDLTAKDYIDLVTDRKSLAGLVDGGYRRSFTEEQHKDGTGTIYDLSFMTSKVKGLLDAVASCHGGQVNQTYAAGQEVVLRGRKVTVKEDSYMWIGRQQSTRSLLEWARPDMLLRCSQADAILGRVVA